MVKKYSVVTLSCLAIGFISLYAVNLSDKPRLDRDLLNQAISSNAKFDPEVDQLFRKTIESAQDLYSPQEFQNFITTEDSDGWSLILHYVSNGQVKQLVWLLDLLKNIYGNDQKTLFDIVFAKDNSGRSPLYIAVMREQLPMVDILLSKSQELFGAHKDLLFEFIESPDDLTKQTPLMLAADLNQYEIMEKIMKVEVAVFGPGAVRLQRNLRMAYVLSDAKGKHLIQMYHHFPSRAGRQGEVTE